MPSCLKIDRIIYYIFVILSSLGILFSVLFLFRLCWTSLDSARATVSSGTADVDIPTIVYNYDGDIPTVITNGTVT